jgi:hypothetical protein
MRAGRAHLNFLDKPIEFLQFRNESKAIIRYGGEQMIDLPRCKHVAKLGELRA